MSVAHRRQSRFGLSAVAFAVLLPCLSACSQDGAAGPADAAGRGAGAGGGRAAGRGGPVAVRTASVVEKPMAVNIRIVGNVEAASTVNVRAQVAGELKTVEFKEGDDVKAGQLLFTIDPRPFELALRQAETQLARDQSQSKTLEAQLARSTELFAKGLVAASQHDTTTAQAMALRGAIASDQVQIDNAKLQLQYTRILAPVAGRTGAILVHEGSLVRNNDATPLVVINQVAPVFVSFAVPARLLTQLQQDRTRGSLRVSAAPAGSNEGAVLGTVSFVDNMIDPGTDTIRLKASFANTDRRLWPGAFVEVTLRLSETPRAVVVPNAAVQASQLGQMVYVVKADQTVEVRPITVGWVEGDETVVATGLAAGDTVVTDGQLRLTPGARITTESGRGEPGGAAGREGGREGTSAEGARSGRGNSH